MLQKLLASVISDLLAMFSGLSSIWLLLGYLLKLGRKRKDEVESDIGEKFIDFLYGQWGAKCHCNKEAASDGEEKYGKNKVVCADGGFHGCFLSGYLEESPAIKAILMAMIMKGRSSRNRTRIIAKIPAKAISMQSEPHSRRRHPVR